MPRLNTYLSIFFTLIVVSPAFAQKQSAANAVPRPTHEQQMAIMQFERNWMNAELLPDTIALARLLDESFISITNDEVLNKQQEIKSVYQHVSQGKSIGIKVDSFQQTNFTINEYAQGVVVTFDCFVYGHNRNIPFVRHSRYYDVLVKKNGVWKGFSSHVIQGLPVETPAYQQLKQRGALWNESYNKRDSITFYSLLDTAVSISGAGGTQVGKEECKNICRKLFAVRPDITWNNQAVSIDINNQWQIAFETGNWTEAWTEKGDTQKSQIRGKYSMMWILKENTWYISSIIFTRLQCMGSYCEKK